MRISILFLVIVILSDLHCQVDVCGCFGCADLLGRYCFSTVESLEILIPILVLRRHSPYGIFSKLVYRLGDPLTTELTCVVVIKAEVHGLELRIVLQHLKSCTVCCGAEGNVRVILPTVLVHGDIGKHINGSLKYEKIFGGAVEMKAVFRNTAVQISFEIELCRGSTFVSMDDFSVLVFANKNSIVMLGIFIDESVLGKAIDDLTVYQSFIHQIAVHPSHICMLFGEFKWFLGLDYRRLSLADDFFTCVASEQTSDGIGIGQPEKLLNEIDCTATNEFVLTEPLASTN